MRRGTGNCEMSFWSRMSSTLEEVQKNAEFCWMWRTGCYIVVPYQILDNFYTMWEPHVTAEHEVYGIWIQWNFLGLAISSSGRRLSKLDFQKHCSGHETIDGDKTDCSWNVGLLAFRPFDSAASRRKCYWKEVYCLFVSFFLFVLIVNNNLEAIRRL
jgi:hypothetical protein